MTRVLNSTSRLVKPISRHQVVIICFVIAAHLMNVLDLRICTEVQVSGLETLASHLLCSTDCTLSLPYILAHQHGRCNDFANPGLDEGESAKTQGPHQVQIRMRQLQDQTRQGAHGLLQLRIPSLFPGHCHANLRSFTV